MRLALPLGVIFAVASSLPMLPPAAAQTQRDGATQRPGGSDVAAPLTPRQREMARGLSGPPPAPRAAPAEPAALPRVAPPGGEPTFAPAPIETAAARPPAPRQAPAAPAPSVTATTAGPAAAAISLHIRFALGSHELTPSARAVLNELGDLLLRPNFAADRIRVEGHTDTLGSADANQILSERRAQSVREHLRALGVAPERVETIGLGEQQLLVPTPDETPNDRNRRVQIVNLSR